MELSDVAKNLWTRYKLPWQNNAAMASERRADFFTRSPVAHGYIEYIECQMNGDPTNPMSTIRYVEQGRISVHKSRKTQEIGLYYEVAESLHQELTARLNRTGYVGRTLGNVKPFPHADGVLVGGIMLPSYNVIEPFFVNFIESRAQAR